MKRVLNCFFTVIIFSFSTVCTAGNWHSWVHSVKPVFDFDQRFFYINNSSTNTWGERAGMLINEKFKIGVGGYYANLATNAVTSGINRGVTSSKLVMYIGTMYFEPFLLRKKYYEVSFPFEAGYGLSQIKDLEVSTGKYFPTVNKPMIPTGASLSISIILPPIGTFKPTRWVGLNFLGGYRYCLFQNKYDTNYNGWFWSISGAIFIDRVFDDIRAYQAKHKTLNSIINQP